LLFRLSGPEEAGRFTAIQQLALAGGMGLVAVGQAAAARLARYHATDRASYRQLSVRLAVLGGLTGVAMFVGAAAMGGVLLSRLFGATYRALSTDLVWMCVASVPSYVASGLGFALTSAGLFRQQVVIHAVALLFVVGVGYRAIAAWGASGAVLAVGVGATAALALSIRYYRTACRTGDPVA
jgi:O-antigen/teichoic acid export membrane protein